MGTVPVQGEQVTSHRSEVSGGPDGLEQPGHGFVPVDALLAGTSAAAFALDSAGRVVDWNAAAERLFGFGHADVIGRCCHDVLACHDALGQALCWSTCPVQAAIRLGKPPPPLDVLARHRSGSVLDVGEQAVLLPAGAQSRVLVLLRPSASGVVDVAVSPPAADALAHSQASWLAPRLDLAASLDRLLAVTGADAAEIFLTTPVDGQLVLAMHRGCAPRAFREIVQFERGHGFPGLVAERGQPVLSLALAQDDRYLRAAVKRRGFRFYLCVPIWGDGEHLGSLHIASRRDADTVTPHRTFLAHVARGLGLALELERRRAAALLADQPVDPTISGDVHLRHVADQSLQALLQVAGADCGTLLLADGETGALRPVSEAGLSPRIRRALARAQPAHCPAVGGRCCVLEASTAEPQSPICRTVHRDLATALCLPLVWAGTPVGVVLLGWLQAEALPARHLVFVHTLVERVAGAIAAAQLAVRHQQVRRDQDEQPAADASRASGRPDGRPEDTIGAARVQAALASPLDLRCLGSFTLSRDHQLIAPERFARRRALTLLKILLTRYGKRVHREELIELLWPAAEPRSADALLHVAVHYLRRGLEPELPTHQPSHFIRTDGDYYAFDTTSPHRLDSQEFVALARLAAQLESNGERTAALDACEQAIALYAGDFLEDEVYSDWCALEREYLRETFLTTLRRAARLHLGRDNVEAALTCYRRALQIDVTLEDVHCALMMTLWQTGRRDEALRQYRQCQVALERELGIAPMPETEALRRRISADSTPAPHRAAH